MECGYKIGRLKNYVYLIKNLVYTAIDYKVYINSGEVYKLDADLVTFNETESFKGRFKFTTTVTCMLSRVINDSILRENEFKIVVEDLKGMLFLVSPEFIAVYTSELNISNTINNLLTFTTESNMPTRIVQSKIIPSNTIETPPCRYNPGRAVKLSLGQNGVFKPVDYLTASYKKVFNGRYDDITITFSIPIENNDWHYDLIKFPNNRWDSKFETTQDILEDHNLFPQYTRLTQEDALDKFTITLKGYSAGALTGKADPTRQFRWIPTKECLCDGFTEYVKEEKLEYIQHTWESVNEYRKGLLIGRKSEKCGFTQHILYRWLNLDPTDFVCENHNKHYKQKEQESKDEGRTWTDTGKFRTGDLIEADSKECGYQDIDWIPVQGQYICEEYDPSVTWVLLPDEFYCSLKNI